MTNTNTKLQSSQPERRSSSGEPTRTAIGAMTLEHNRIKTVVNSLANAVTALERGKRLNTQKLRGVVEFLRIYADERHHVREEELFFPVLMRHGVPAQGCPIGGLNHEHDVSRSLVSSLDQWLTGYEARAAGAETGLRQTLHEIIQLYRKHLWMEDEMVFPMAARLLTAEDDQKLGEQFADLDFLIGSERIARLEQFAERLTFPAGHGTQRIRASLPYHDCGCGLPVGSRR